MFSLSSHCKTTTAWAATSPYSALSVKNTAVSVNRRRRLHPERRSNTAEKLSDLPYAPLWKHWSIITKSGPAVFRISTPQLDISPPRLSNHTKTVNSSRWRTAEPGTLDFNTLLKTVCHVKTEEKTSKNGRVGSVWLQVFEPRRELLTVRREWPAPRRETGKVARERPSKTWLGNVK